MPIPLGVLAVAGAGGGGGAAGNAYELLETTTLGSDANSVTISSINSTYGSTYQHLQVRLTGVATTTDQGVLQLYMRINNDTTNNYAAHVLFGNGSSVTSSSWTTTSFMRVGHMPDKFSSYAGQGATVIDILDAFETTKNKVSRSLSGHGGGNFPRVSVYSALWQSTSAVDSLRFSLEGTFNFAAGSRFSLYGMRSS